MLGKRKWDAIAIPRQSWKESQNTDVLVDNETHNLFRQHFEARFKPLEAASTRKLFTGHPPLTSSAEDSGSEWEGICDPDAHHAAEVVEHRASWSKTDVVSDKQARKEFMVCI
jgi:hypothetical protein